MEYSGILVRLFEGKGGWEDVHRVIRLCENFPTIGMPFLSIVKRGDDYKTAAKAILKLGKNRIADVLLTPMPAELWNAVLKATNKASFASFGDDRLSEWLRDDIESKRKAVALKCVICLPKSRIDKLLKSYISGGGPYFYNVVSWLDLGVSAERASAIEIANQAFEEL